MNYSIVADRLEGALGSLPDAERPDAERIVAISRAVDERSRTNGLLDTMASDGELRRELGSLVERLSRRSARAVPFASLGRTLLADLGGSRRDAESAMSDCETRLALFGF